MNLKRLSPLLLLSISLAACGNETTGTPGISSGSSITVTANKSIINLTATGVSTDTDPTTTFTFVNKAGGAATTIQSAVIKFGNSQTLNVLLAGISVPSGFSCSDGSTTGCSTANLQFTGKTITQILKDADLFKNLPGLNTGKTSIPVELDFDGVSNALNFTVNVGANTTTPTVPAAPAVPSPVLVINNTEAQPYSNVLSVTASGGIAAGLTATQLILEITDSNGLVDNTSYTATSGSATFSVDTSKYPDGNLSLRVIAIDSNNQTGTSASKQIQIRNLVAPSFTLVSPVTGSTVNGATVAKVQIRRNNTAFTFVQNNVTFNVLDYRGQILKTQIATVTNPNPGVFEASTTFDINGPQFPNNIYTIEAVSSVTLSGETAVRNLRDQTQFTTQNSNNKPPALIIQMPVRPNTYDLAAKKFPVINRNSGVMVQMSDDNGVTNVQMQLTCDPSISQTGQICPASAYQVNFPINQSGLFYRVFNIGSLLDGEPYVQNGNYILRFTVTDGTNTNIQEIPVTVDRVQNTIAGLTNSDTAIDPNACSQALNVDSYLTGIGSVTWTPSGTTCDLPGAFVKSLDQNTNPVRVIQLEYSTVGAGLALEVPSLVGILPELPAQSTIVGGESPSTAGTYRTSFIVEDLTTGIVVMYQGDNVNVKTNP